MITLTFGDKFSYNAAWEGEKFCAVCNKALGSTALELCLDVNNRIITIDEYNNLSEAQLVLIGSTCAKKFAEGVVA
jgi:hypothetical protein